MMNMLEKDGKKHAPPKVEAHKVEKPSNNKKKEVEDRNFKL